MVDPSKDQFYQQRLAPWAAAGYGSHHPSLATTASTSSFPPNLYDASRLQYSLAGLHPTPPSVVATAAAAAAAASAYSKEPRHTYGSHYPMNLAALSALSNTDFNRQHHGLHPPTSSSSNSSGGGQQQAPLPAHLPRHQSYPNYHDTYHHAGYYNNGGSIHGPHGQAAPPRGHVTGQPSASHNGYEPPPPSYAIPGLKDYSSRPAVTGQQKAHSQQQQQPVHDSNGFKVCGAGGAGAGGDGVGGGSNHYPPPFSYPPTQNGPAQA